ncbi:MAG TPA: ribonuclease H-like domain-containing protein [Armatimonadota bacterium]|nr:ribonuclease H-like domain-containing protein [Armatimonadota bacterium]
MLSRDLRRKLSRIGAIPPPADGAAPQVRPPRPSRPAPWDIPEDSSPVFFPVADEGDEFVDLLGGGEIDADFGPFWLTELEVEGVWPRARALLDDLATRPGAAPDIPEMQGLEPSDLLVFDIETAGLMGATLFLAGVLDFLSGAPRLRFFLARDYDEEPAMLDALAAHMARTRAIVTFNGKSFDVPFLADRMRYHRLRFDPPPVHIDILHAARRRWRGRFENCRLQTLERELCGRHRTDDVPSEWIPAVYHEFVATQDAELLVPILQHNALDLLTLWELLCATLATPVPNRAENR